MQEEEKNDSLQDRVRRVLLTTTDLLLEPGEARRTTVRHLELHLKDVTRGDLIEVLAVLEENEEVTITQNQDDIFVTIVE